MACPPARAVGVPCPAPTGGHVSVPWARAVSRTQWPGGDCVHDGRCAAGCRRRHDASVGDATVRRDDARSSFCATDVHTQRAGGNFGFSGYQTWAVRSTPAAT
ncbi:MAG: hypothetical protein H8D74_01335 [Chloroflexi bacterium]|nr:hypothetical protein [Chloroflexota bacterium]